jgi:acyl-CoA synthetase (AMP-forming)/AMP-acid ligase II
MVKSRIDMVEDRSGWLVRRDAAWSEAWTATGTWTGLTLADHAKVVARDFPNYVLLIDGERQISAKQLYIDALKAAQALASSGLEPGDVVSLMLPNWHEAAILNLAATMAGLVVNPIIPIYRGAEVIHILRDSRSRMVFMPEVFRKFDYRELAREVSGQLDTPPEFVVLRGDAGEFTNYGAFVARARNDVEMPETRSSDVMMVLYTSGTTGPAKGVLHTHDAGDVMVRDYDRCWGPWQGETLLVASPVTHITGAIQALFVPIQCRATAILMDIWDPREALELLKRHQATFFGGATPFHQGILAEAKADGEHLPAVRIIACGGAAVPPGLMRAEHDHFPTARVFRAYGCSEVPAVTEGTRSRDEIDYGAETDGWVGETQVRLVKPETDEPVAEGEEGEILAHGAQIFVGYTNLADNEGAFTADGFFRTGDLGRMRDGFLTVTGRIKDLIIRNGENLSAKEIEDALEDLPGITEVAVVGVPSERTGEAVCAVFVSGRKAHFTLAEISAHLHAKGLARQKVPEHVVSVSALPRNLAGKVRKDVLRTQVLEILEDGEGAQALTPASPA